MKVLINKTHEIEVDEKFRDMFPMENGCINLEYCDGCPFKVSKCTIPDVINIYKFTAEIVDDQIKFEDLKIGQKVWYLEEEREILGLRKWDNPKRFITLRNHGYGYGWDERDWDKIKYGLLMKEENDLLQQKITTLETKLEKIFSEFKNHLETMQSINVHMGYKFTQPLINAHQALAKIREE